MSYLELPPARPLAETRNEGYTHNMPGPPRIQIPPLMGVRKSMETTCIKRPVYSPYNLDFLESLKITLQPDTTASTWPYDKRREAQSIIPFLYLGPFTAAKDTAFLQQEDITMALGIRHKGPTFNGVAHATEPIGVRTVFIDLADVTSPLQVYMRASILINEHLATLYEHSQQTTGTGKVGKVLVFCESGNERSAAVAAAYLMEMLQGFDHVSAMQLCGFQRFCCNFTDDIKESLLAYHEILKAKRVVDNSNFLTASHHGLSEGSSDSLDRVRPKRPRPLSYDDDGDAPMGMVDDNYDRGRFEGRKNTPFS